MCATGTKRHTHGHDHPPTGYLTVLGTYAAIVGLLGVAARLPLIIGVRSGARCGRLSSTCAATPARTDGHLGHMCTDGERIQLTDFRADDHVGDQLAPAEHRRQALAIFDRLEDPRPTPSADSSGTTDSHRQGCTSPTVSWAMSGWSRPPTPAPRHHSANAPQLR
jgi:hypothetical protein